MTVLSCGAKWGCLYEKLFPLLVVPFDTFNGSFLVLRVFLIVISALFRLEWKVYVDTSPQYAAYWLGIVRSTEAKVGELLQMRMKIWG